MVSSIAAVAVVVFTGCVVINIGEPRRLLLLFVVVVAVVVVVVVVGGGLVAVSYC